MRSSRPGARLGFAYSGLLDNYLRTLGVEQHSLVYPISSTARRQDNDIAGRILCKACCGCFELNPAKPGMSYE